MNSAIEINYASRLLEAYRRSGVLRCPDTRNGGFLELASQVRASANAEASAVAENSSMDLETYKQSIREKISQLPMSASSKMQSISVRISDAGFEAMKNDPEYEAWVLDTLAQNFQFENPWTTLCGGGYAVHSFGASKEEYHGESWYPGYMGGQGGDVFEEKAKGGFWEQRMENHKKFMELQREAAARRRLMLKLQRGEPLSAAELLMGLL